MSTSPKILRVALAAASATVLSSIREASVPTWAERHPHRAEVNTRLANRRFNTQLRKGGITRGRARALNQREIVIRRKIGR